MAAPEKVTSKNLTGKFYMDKTLSDDIDDVLQEQAVSWLLRNALYYATITLDVKHYADDDGVEHIDIEQTATGGIKGTTENRILDWQERAREDYIFGNLKGKSRRTTLAQVEDEYLKTGWLPEAETDGVIEAFVINEEKGWTASQIWGFQEVEGKRYYVRLLKFVKEDRILLKKLVYDYFE